jgi:membrane protein
MAKRVLTLVDRIMKNIALPEMKILPGQLAFFFVLTLVPIIALILSIVSNLRIPTNVLNTMIENQFPDTIVEFVKYLSSNDGANINTIIFFVSALVFASNGTYSMIIASNQIYKIKNKGLIYDRIKAIFLMFILIFLLIFIVFVPVFGDFIVKFVTTIVKNSNINYFINIFYQVVNLPLSWFFIFISIKLLYTIAPDNKISSKNVNYGAFFTSLTWILFTKLYSLYINTFGGYANIYGSISSLLVLMWWIYFLSYLFVMGMALNVSKYEDKKE